MASGDRETELAEALWRASAGPALRPAWWQGAVFYEIYVRSFMDADGDGLGDLRGVIDKLDYLAGLGVDGIWLSPFYPSPQEDFGYDITDFCAVDPRFGTLAILDELVRETHARGLKLLLDFVPAHTSDQHPWFRESRASRDNAQADWYVWADAAPDGGPPNNWLSSFGGSAWTWEPRRAQYYFHPFLICQPALDLRRAEVLDAMLGVMRFWLDRGVDGFRLDAVQCLTCDRDLRSNPPVSSAGSSVWVGGGPNNPFGRQMHLFDRDVPEAIAIIERMREAVNAYEPERVLIGELADVDSSRIADKYTLPDTRFHAVYDFDLINCPPQADVLSEVLRIRSRFARAGWLMNVLSNHDAVRAVSNKAPHAVEAGRATEAAKLLLFLQLTLRGGAVIYQGDELGLTHPSLAYEEIRDPWGLNLWPDFQGRDGARTPMPWRAAAHHAGFTDADEPWLTIPAAHREVAVDRQEDDPSSCLTFTRELLAWRKREPLLHDGRQRMHDLTAGSLIVFDRLDDERTLRLVVNYGLQEERLTLDPGFERMTVPGTEAALDGNELAVPSLRAAVLQRATST